MQRALIQYRNPKNYYLVKEALLAAHREDLIGSGPKCLIRAVPPRAGGHSAPPKAGSRPASSKPGSPTAAKTKGRTPPPRKAPQKAPLRPSRQKKTKR